MTTTFLRCLNRGGVAALGIRHNVQMQIAGAVPLPAVVAQQIAHYSRRSNSNEFDNGFKVVKSKVRLEEEDAENLGVECGPNWELLAPRSNRFYFPNAIGPAWQGASTTHLLESPLEDLIDFEGSAKADQKEIRLEFSVRECPSLIKKSLHELFPASEVVNSDSIALMTLRFTGETEQGARKFVLAAREITSRLRLQGFWADFMNPFSGRPFYTWANNRNLYRVDQRFRGLNMKVIEKNNCTIISPEDENNFSGAIYTNAPSDYLELRVLIDEQV